MFYLSPLHVPRAKVLWADKRKLFNNIQVSNDKFMVANGHAMTKLLNAARREAKISRRLADQPQMIALEMREDSVAMKTVSTCSREISSNDKVNNRNPRLRY